MDCPNCEKPMRKAKEWKSSVLYKCDICGHQTLIQNDAEIVPKRQDWERNNYGKKTSDA